MRWLAGRTKKLLTQKGKKGLMLLFAWEKLHRTYANNFCTQSESWRWMLLLIADVIISH